jgi:thiazole biosynthesis enzyme
MIDEVQISRAIISSYYDELLSSLEADVVIGGAGPSGLSAAYFLAREGLKVVVFERHLRPGGGMAGGGMLFNKIVVQEEARSLLELWGIRFRPFAQKYYVASSLEALAGLLLSSLRAGAHIFNGIAIEDVMVRNSKVQGVVINWSAVDMAGLHVDPLTVRSHFVIDATGHAAEIAQVVARKTEGKLLTATGGVVGERPMWAEEGERLLLVNTREVYPNLYVCGMAANAVFGGPRMGPIFGGMLLSGQRVAQLILERYRAQKNNLNQKENQNR